MQISKDAILEAAWEADIDPEDDIRWDYSGRWMYGAKCFGIIGNTAAYARFLLKLAEGGNPDAAWELADVVRTDSMAYDTIFYFPNVDVVDENKTADK